MLNKKVIIVTGGSGYLGSTFVQAILERGGIAVIADIDEAASEKLSKQLTIKYPGKVCSVTMDITNKSSICGCIAQINKKYGKIDAVVNNAYPRNPNYGNKLEQVTFSDFCDNTSMHLGGYFLVAQQFALFFRQKGGGNIVNISSVYGTMTPRFEIYDKTVMTMPVEYAAIKSSIIQLTRYFAKYFSGEQIRVNCLSPGGILNNQPVEFLEAYNSFCNEKGMLDPVDIVEPLMFLLSDQSKYITAQNLIVDDGFSL